MAEDYYNQAVSNLQRVTALAPESSGSPLDTAALLQKYRAQAMKRYGVGTPVDTSGIQAAGSSGQMPGGRWGQARASSYWGPGRTAGGQKMSFQTIASPYLPLGTVVEIMKGKKTVRGVVQDFGPADWVMKGDPNRFLDISEPMMQQLTGQRSNLLGVNYRIAKYGTGRVYRPGHEVTRRLKKEWSG